ncbi:hypothetical protein ACI3ET_06690 [Ornithinimicrobium sp. LYQ121]|uniref:hypothetical protein n=1 Tax=Ornithinimicrobium sp. LYQ121 TaxID=3378801 RepID=UPI003854D84D
MANTGTKRTSKKNVVIESVFNVRESRGLTTNEKSFLWAVTSRGVCSTTRARLMGDTGLSDGTVTNVVKSLSEKGLVEVHRGGWANGRRATTWYVVDDAALADWCERTKDVWTGDDVQEGADPGEELARLLSELPESAHLLSESTQDVSESAHLLSEYAHLLSHKGTGKVTDKVTPKETSLVPKEEPQVWTDAELDKALPWAVANSEAGKKLSPVQASALARECGKAPAFGS